MKNLANLDPLDYLKIIWRRRWYLLGGFILVVIGTAIYSWRTPDVFKSVSIIRIEPGVIPQDYARSSDRTAPEQQIAGIRRHVQSRSFGARLIQDFQLFGYGITSDFSMDAAIKALGRNIEVVNVSKDTFQISVISADAQLAQTILRRVIDTLIQSSNSSRRDRAVEADQFIDEQLRQTEQKLLAQEEKIKQFKIAHLGGLPEQSAANMNAINGLNAQLVAVENALQQIREQQKQMGFRAQQQKQLNMLSRSILDQPSLSHSDEIMAGNHAASNPLLAARQAELKALLLKYTPNHPDVIRIRTEIEGLRHQAESNAPQDLTPGAENKENTAALEESSVLGSDTLLDIGAAEARLQAETYKSEIAKREKERDGILSQIRLYQNRLNLAPTLEQEFMGLSREHEIIRQQYSSLQSKKFQAQLTTNLETGRSSDVYKIIDEANLPETPTFPNRLQIILLGLVGGIGLGLCAAFGRELLDTTLGNEDDAAALLQLPVLASISEIPTKEPRRLIRISEEKKSA